jgi:hypothetical protein
MFNTSYTYKKTQRKKKPTKTQKQIHSNNIPTPIYETTPNAPNYDQETKIITRVKAINIPCTLSTLPEKIERKFDIDKKGRTVALIYVKSIISYTNLPFTVKVSGSGDAGNVLNKNDFDNVMLDNSDTVEKHDCFTYIPGNIPTFKNEKHTNDVLYSDCSTFVRERVNELNEVKELKKKVADYIKRHKILQVLNENGELVGPRNEDEYITQVIKLSNLVDVNMVEEQCKEIIEKTNGKYFQTTTSRDKRAFFDLVHMTVADNLLYLSKDWKTDLKQEPLYPIKKYNDVMKLHKNITSTRGVFKKLPLVFEPMVPHGINLKSYGSARENIKPEAKLIYLKVEMKYRVLD